MVSENRLPPHTTSLPLPGLGVRTKMRIGEVILYISPNASLRKEKYNHITDLLLKKQGEIEGYSSVIVDPVLNHFDTFPPGLNLTVLPTLTGYPLPDSKIEGFDAIFKILA
jgi:hypothetical protein